MYRTPFDRYRENMISQGRAFYENTVPGPGELFIRWNGSREQGERQVYTARSAGLKTQPFVFSPSSATSEVCGLG